MLELCTFSKIGTTIQATLPESIIHYLRGVVKDISIGLDNEYNVDLTINIVDTLIARYISSCYIYKVKEGTLEIPNELNTFIVVRTKYLDRPIDVTIGQVSVSPNTSEYVSGTLYAN